MQERKVDRIDVAFVALEIVASLKDFGHRPVFSRHREKFIIRQQRRLARAHVSENHAARFATRVSAMMNLAAVSAAARLARLFEHAAGDIVKPAVIKAAQAAVFDAPITQVGAAMRTMQSKQTGPPLVVAKQHQVLVHDPNLQRRTARRQLLAKRNRLPITPQEFAGGRLRTRLRK